jgi:uncharacterized membrane protein
MKDYSRKKETARGVQLWEEIPLWAILAIPMGYLIAVFPSLPDSVPMHYNMAGEIDRYGSKAELWLPILLINIPLYFIMMAVPSFEKKEVRTREWFQSFFKVRVLLHICMSALSIVIVQSSVKEGFDPGRPIGIILCLIFAGLGLIMATNPKNHAITMNTPWTIKDPIQLKKTHDFLKWSWIIGGLVGIPVFLVTPSSWFFAVTMIFTITISTIPIVYSWQQSK